MQFDITGNEKTEICVSVSISAGDVASGKDLRQRTIHQNKTELQWWSFEGIHIILVKAEKGRLKICNEVKEPYITTYGLLTGDLVSENISGEITFFNLTAGQHNLYYPAPLVNILQMEAPLQAFIIYLPEQYLLRLLHNTQGISSYLRDHILNKKAFITGALPVNPNIYQIINTIKTKQQHGDAGRILLEAKMLELLSVQLEQLDQTYIKSSSSFLKAHDIDKIYSAKLFIEENIRTPCSLIELSRKVGLNDFKLKKGFKEILGTTVFSYLSDFRMERARQLLEQKKSVSEVAYEVGYKNPHHFTAAFKKKFGMLPSVITKTMAAKNTIPPSA